MFLRMHRRFRHTRCLLFVVALVVMILLITTFITQFSETRDQPVSGSNEFSRNSSSKINQDLLLLVLFTTFDERPTKPHHAAAHRVAIRNWTRLRIYYSCLTAGDSIVKPIPNRTLTAHQLAQQRRSWAEQRTAAPAARQEK